MTSNLRKDRRAILLFARCDETEHKRLGLGSKGDRRLGELLLRRTVRTLALVDPSVAIIVASDRPLPRRMSAELHARSRTVIEIEQRGGEFETRFTDALRRGFALGFDRLAAVGTDTPSLVVEDLGMALADPRLVLGPSLDGGVYLIGLDAPDLELLDRLPWCTDRLCSAMLERARVARRACSFRRMRADVDHALSVRRQWSSLNRLSRLILGAALEERPSPIAQTDRALHSQAERGSLGARGPPLL